jgi:2-hydroxychromene-2-carboxylate isomerase
MSNAIVPYLANMLFSTRLLNLKRALQERKRKRRQQPHMVTAYLCINDAYSYLLIQVLADFQTRYGVEFDFRCVLNKQQEMYPAPKLWGKNAFVDGHYLAELYQLDFPQNAPEVSTTFDKQITAQLLHWELEPGFLDKALKLFQYYWQGNELEIQKIVNPAIASHTECYRHHLLANENLLKENGHYLSAMLHYGGEWYWGLDRLQYLEQRLNELGLNNQASVIKYDLGKKHFCQQLTERSVREACDQGLNHEPLEMYWSIRSPYSYIALIRAKQLASYYHVPLVVKPVLPMVMRRMQVPNTKKFYISFDAKREAKQVGLDFGCIADPLGKGVERCYALYEYAQSQGLGLEYLESYARGVWAQGIRSDTDNGLKKIVERAGLNWQEAQSLLSDNTWRSWAQDNLAQLYAEDMWGVPSFKYLDHRVFGQDRINYLERAIVQRFNIKNDATKIV